MEHKNLEIETNTKKTYVKCQLRFFYRIISDLSYEEGQDMTKKITVSFSI